MEDLHTLRSLQHASKLFLLNRPDRLNQQHLMSVQKDLLELNLKLLAFLDFSLQLQLLKIEVPKQQYHLYSVKSRFGHRQQFLATKYLVSLHSR